VIQSNRGDSWGTTDILHGNIQIHGNLIDAAIRVPVFRKPSDIDNLLQLRLGRLSDNSEISIAFLLVLLLSHGSKKKTDKRVKIMIVWLRYLLHDLKVSCNLSPQLFLWQSNNITYSSKLNISWTHKNIEIDCQCDKNYKSDNPYPLQLDGKY